MNLFRGAEYQRYVIHLTSVADTSRNIGGGGGGREFGLQRLTIFCSTSLSFFNFFIYSLIFSLRMLSGLKNIVPALSPLSHSFSAIIHAKAFRKYSGRRLSATS